MKISVLKNREPFDKILISTLKLFFNSLYNENYKIKLSSKFSLKKNNDINQVWYCNTLINSIFMYNVNNDVFSSINGEYSFNPNKPFKSFFQKVYLKLSQTKYFNILLSHYTYVINPGIENGRNKLIIGGNKKIRIIDIEKKEVFVILKKDFDKIYIQREIFIRKNFSFISTPKIIQNHNNNFWYSEEYVSGIPPNRLKKSKFKIILDKIISELVILREKTKKTTYIEEYLIILNSKFNNDLENTLLFSDSKKNEIRSILNSINQFVVSCSDKEIFTSICHGDFHLGNILTNEDKYWLIDWENSCERNYAYDLFIFLLKSRNDKSFAEDIIKIFKGEFESDQLEIIRRWPELISNDSNIKKIYILIFLIEDLQFYIEENNNNNFYINSNILTNRISEYNKIIFYLDNNA